jgi:hypothetical protein
LAASAWRALPILVVWSGRAASLATVWISSELRGTRAALVKVLDARSSQVQRAVGVCTHTCTVPKNAGTARAVREIVGALGRIKIKLGNARLTTRCYCWCAASWWWWTRWWWTWWGGRDAPVRVPAEWPVAAAHREKRLIVRINAAAARRTASGVLACNRRCVIGCVSAVHSARVTPKGTSWQNRWRRW